VSATNVTDGTSETVRREVVDGVGIVSMNRPDKHNALNNELSRAMHQGLEWALSDPAVRVLLLRGEGKSFTSGRDTTQLGTRDPGVSDYHFVLDSQKAKLQLLDSTKPIVVAMKGFALGGGLELALGGDIRVAATDIRIGFPEVRFGIMTDTGGMPYTTMLAGPSRAKYLVMTGDLIGADQALAWGLVDFVYEPDQVDEEALKLAKRLAAGPPLSLAMIKQTVDGMWAGAIRQGLQAELLGQCTLFKSQDYQEARAALLEKRPATYTGT
jgi:enoyl-CoA hydratase/carnithine racemase